MKALKITLKILIVAAIFGVIALLLARIVLQDYLPDRMRDFKMTQLLDEKYSLNKDDLTVYTQKPLISYDNAKQGNFFATSVYCIPDEDHLQFSIRYNQSTLPRVEAHYQTVLPEGAPLDLFDFSVLVSYDTGNREETDFRRYELSPAECETEHFLMYHYTKLVFENIEFDGAIWMRVDISLKEDLIPSDAAEDVKANPFGSIVVYEDYEVTDDGLVVDYPLEVYPLSEKEKLRG